MGAGSCMGSIYLTSTIVREQLCCPKNGTNWFGKRHWYHHIGMKPQTIGRILGIGVRVTGRFIGQQISATVQPSDPVRLPSGNPGQLVATRPLRSARTVGQTSRGIARGVGGFLAPFRRVANVLWLEVTGVFFFLPVAVFAPTLWRVRTSYAHGPEHNTFLLTASVMLVFLYLSVSSFWRARNR